MEKIFSGVGSDMSPILGGDEENQDAHYSIYKAINDSISYEESELSTRRELDMAYYEGFLPDIDGHSPTEDMYSSHDLRTESELEDDGTSKFVSTDVRDTIMSILPSLIRIFSSSENVVTFTPNSEENSEMAKEALDYANHVFWDENEGFLLLHTIFKDALMLASGIVTWRTDNDEEVTEQTFEGITGEQLMFLLHEQPDAEVIELEGDVQSGQIDLVTLRHAVSKPKLVIDPVPPEEFRVSPDATSIYKSKIVGRERVESKSYLVKRGYDPEWLDDIGTEGSSYSAEKWMRNPGMADASTNVDGILFGEWYARVDFDGDGIDELRYVTTVGPSRIIVENYVEQKPRFALFCPDPKAHTAIGNSIAWLTRDIQRLKSNMMRASLDNLANAVVPRTGINELLTNMEDALDPASSGIIRTRTNPGEAIKDLTTPFVGAQVFEMVDRIDMVRASRTGITEASKGLDPDAMQSTAMVGINAIISGAQERIELIALILAHTGFKPLFEGLLREIVNNPNPEKMIHIRGNWRAVNPSTFDPTMKVKVNPTLGKGSDTIRMMALQEVKSMQTAIISQYGLGNGLVGIPEVRNTITDLLDLANIKDVSRYFRVIDEAQVMAIEQAPKEPSPEELLARAEMEKTRAKVAEALGKKKQAEDKLQLDEDFRRDELALNSMLEAASIFASFPPPIGLATEIEEKADA